MFKLTDPKSGDTAMFIIKSDRATVALKLAGRNRYEAPVQVSIEAARESYRRHLRLGWKAA